MKRSEWRASATEKLKSAGVSTPDLDVLVLLEHTLRQDRSIILAHDDNELSADEQRMLDEMISRRESREPLAYIVGHKEFYGLDFSVSEHVLIPRPETEIMVEYAIERAPKDAHCLEIGTGSGCISIALAHHRPDLTITASDVSSDVMSVAKKNAAANQVDVSFRESDLFDTISGEFGVVLANLPYVPLPARRQPEIEHEPDVSLYGGEDGLDHYRNFFAELSDYTTKKPLIIVEFSPTQYAAARETFNNYSIEPLSEYIYLFNDQ